MIPVFQDRMHDPTGKNPPGNCFAACLASIMRLQLRDLPDEKDFWSPGMNLRESWSRYYQALLVWLGDRHLTLVHIASEAIVTEWVDTYTILSGPSPRGPWLHAVVAVGPRIIHDPHPGGTGLAPGKRTVTYLVATHPWKNPTRDFAPPGRPKNKMTR